MARAILLLAALLAAAHGLSLTAAPLRPTRVARRAPPPSAMPSPDEPSADEATAAAPPAPPAPPAPAAEGGFLSQIPGPLIVFGGAAILGLQPWLKTGIVSNPPPGT